ncbi:hypothetical protein E2C01_042277 [Portunus trituberculatus]|uniref:Uncharacterized protein n=1 Tax=Portunus trituberculatus TaxID=210409 RepID=A0A5B7FU67_PORTR|nr:hypothetical protein [Portunus trituberculatus]
MWSPDKEKMMLELVREKNTFGTPEINYTVKKSLRKSSFDEMAATLQELFPSVQVLLEIRSFVGCVKIQKKSEAGMSAKDTFIDE